jgi:hypothetical protein
MNQEARKVLLGLKELEDEGLSYCNSEDYKKIVEQLGVPIGEAVRVWAPKDYRYPWQIEDCHPEVLASDLDFNIPRVCSLLTRPDDELGWD